MKLHEHIQKHPKRLQWTIYVFIALFGAGIFFFVVTVLTSQQSLFEKLQRKKLEQMKAESQVKVDSLTTIADSTIEVQQHAIESLAKRKEAITIRAIKEKQTLIKKYEAEFKMVDSISDGAVDSIHKQCRERHDHFFGE